MPPPASSERATEVSQALFAKREKIYPREVHGLFAFLRVSAGTCLLGIYYLTPWINWDGRQAVLFDLPARKFYIFGWTLWPQDFIYLTLLLMLAAFSLFFFTALAGRLWCGYACPQTVWTESFLAIERFVEGSRLQQMKLDSADLSWRKVRIKATKHALWIAFAAFTGFTFVAYFSPARALLGDVLAFRLGPWETFWMVFYAFATYGNAGWMREQVCKYMCPYARFQAAMFDRDTLIISYDEKRGEPRGSRRADADPAALGLGDCINCTMCVQVCPTGIDIRDGLQYECIGCSACIDVCNDVMRKMSYEPGLIRYTTQNAVEGRPTRILRPRIVIYGLMLLVLLVGFVWSIATRDTVALDVLRDRNQLYRESGGKIENVYTLKIVNMNDEPLTFVITATGIAGLEAIVETEDVDVAAGAVANIPVRLRADEAHIGGRSAEVQFELTVPGRPGFTTSQPARFLGP